MPTITPIPERNEYSNADANNANGIILFVTIEKNTQTTIVKIDVAHHDHFSDLHIFIIFPLCYNFFSNFGSK